MPLHTVCHVNKASTKLSPAFASVRLENETNKSINIDVYLSTILDEDPKNLIFILEYKFPSLQI